MAHIGHPLIGDKRYGGPNVVKFPELEQLHGRKGHLLNAQEIGFKISNSKVNILSKIKLTLLPSQQGLFFGLELYFLYQITLVQHHLLECQINWLFP